MKIPFNAISMATLLGALLALPVSADDNTEAFKKLDVNGDGFITETEALAHAELPDVFGEADENGDNQLDLNEFAVLEITDE
jgi:Ca2+-binding EF-hand superfamily protein